jgi:hypothetical protein
MCVALAATGIIGVAVTGNPLPLVVVALAAYALYHVTKAIGD